MYSQKELAEFHRDKVHPPCSTCQQPEALMYTAFTGHKYILKRMPHTWMYHSLECPLHSLSSSSGLNELIDGGAIRENLETKEIELKLGFSLSKKIGQTKERTTSEMSDTVKSEGISLTLCSLLEFVWEKAEFQELSSHIERMLTWDDIKEQMLKSLENLRAHKSKLVERSYIPGSFQSIDEKTDQMCRVTYSDGKSEKVGIVIGKLVDFHPPTSAKGSFKLDIKNNILQMNIDEKTYHKLSERYANQLSVWRNFDKTINIIVIATFVRKKRDDLSFNVLEFALMPTTKDWVPYANRLEKELIEKLISDNRHFDKCFRYNLSADKPVPCVVLHDTDPPDVEMYVWPKEGLNVKQELSLEKIKKFSPITTWIWREEYEPDLPPLPPCC